jgi:hypothetical protein
LAFVPNKTSNGLKFVDEKYVYAANTFTNFSPFEILFGTKANNQENFLKKNVDFRAVQKSINYLLLTKSNLTSFCMLLLLLFAGFDFE